MEKASEASITTHNLWTRRRPHLWSNKEQQAPHLTVHGINLHSYRTNHLRSKTSKFKLQLMKKSGVVEVIERRSEATSCPGTSIRVHRATEKIWERNNSVLSTQELDMSRINFLSRTTHWASSACLITCQQRDLWFLSRTWNNSTNQSSTAGKI